MLSRIYGILDSASEGQWPRFGLGVTPTPCQTSTGHPPEPAAVIAWQRAAAALETAKTQLMAPTGKGTPKVKSKNFSDDDDSLQKQIRVAVKQSLQVKQQGHGGKGAKAKDGGQSESGSRP